MPNWLIILAVLAVGMALVVSTVGPMMAPEMAPPHTKNTTRLTGKNFYETAAAVSQLIYPATMPENRPGSVILVRDDRWGEALVAASLIHFPNNAPILFTGRDRLPQATRQALKRLGPTGVDRPSGRVEVYLVGDISDRLRREVERLGYRTERVSGKDALEVSASVDAVRTQMEGNTPIPNVLIASLDDYRFAMPVASWISHMPAVMLYVQGEEIPELTRRALEQRGGNANIYVIGPERLISPALAQQLEPYGTVQRISGPDPVEHAIALAKFKDPATGVGWGATRPGFGYTFAAPESWHESVMGALLAHMGKHAPILFVHRGQSALPPALQAYLIEVKPTFTDTPAGKPRNHGWILGGTNEINIQLQGQIDTLLEIVPAGEGM